MQDGTPPQLPDDIEACHALLSSQAETIQDLSARIDYLTRRLFGPRAERFDPGQLHLFQSAEAAAPEASAESEAAPPSKRKGHGRKALPEDLLSIPSEGVTAFRGIAPPDSN